MIAMDGSLVEIQVHPATTLAISSIIALAILPPAMRQLNTVRKRPGIEHISSAFSIGFFVDLIMKAVLG